MDKERVMMIIIVILIAAVGYLLLGDQITLPKLPPIGSDESGASAQPVKPAVVYPTSVPTVIYVEVPVYINSASTVCSGDGTGIVPTECGKPIGNPSGNDCRPGQCPDD